MSVRRRIRTTKSLTEKNPNGEVFLQRNILTRNVFTAKGYYGKKKTLRRNVLTANRADDEIFHGEVSYCKKSCCGKS